jgi:allantoin racemase
VVDITEAAAVHAMLLGHRYGVVTTTATSVAQIEDSLLTAGLDRRCAVVLATEVATGELADDEERTVAAFVASGRRALDAGAEVICLGCAGLTTVAHRVAAALGVPVVDGVAAAVTLVEKLHATGLRTSKAGAYASPPPTDRPGWSIRRRSSAEPAGPVRRGGR